ncbi:hypothetical protein HJC23_002902 [Cyclotella cryptica]|uniref:Uncharacterized protein n=1 Tax=Cyclotella cryptica TaxID=29204 RepID=A0ABD3PJ40_9STRA
MRGTATARIDRSNGYKHGSGLRNAYKHGSGDREKQKCFQGDGENSFAKTGIGREEQFVDNSLMKDNTTMGYLILKAGTAKTTVEEIKEIGEEATEAAATAAAETSPRMAAEATKVERW